MIKIIIAETRKIESLSFIDPITGVDSIRDYLGDFDAFKDGSFIWSEDDQAYLCDQETFEAWDKVTRDQEQLAQRVNRLRKDYPAELIEAALDASAEVDLEDQAEVAHRGLDEMIIEAGLREENDFLVDSLYHQLGAQVDIQAQIDALEDGAFLASLDLPCDDEQKQAAVEFLHALLVDVDMDSRRVL